MIPSQLTMHVDGLDPRIIVQGPTNLPTFALRDLVYEGCNINWLLAAEPRRVPKWRPFPIASCDGGESIKKFHVLFVAWVSPTNPNLRWVMPLIPWPTQPESSGKFVKM